MNERGTMRTGPLGSTIHVLRADAETVAELAAIDWNRTRYRGRCASFESSVPGRCHGTSAGVCLAPCRGCRHAWRTRPAKAG